jgi:ubiquitin-protein ligase E3 C
VLTQTGKELYPNAKSKSLFKDDIHIYKFLGRILGKAIYDGITVEPQFANFFLKKLIGKQNNLNDLKSLDPDLHKNLNFIKEYEGSVEDLSLTF